MNWLPQAEDSVRAERIRKLIHPHLHLVRLRGGPLDDWLIATSMLEHEPAARFLVGDGVSVLYWRSDEPEKEGFEVLRHDSTR